jgi:hypothetical protein
MGGSGTSRLSDELVRFLQSGVAIVVATRDEELRSEIARGWGLDAAPDAGTVTLCVDAARESRTRANLETNGAVAVTCSRPSTYRTVQLKGTVAELRDPGEEQLTAVRRHLEAFAEEAALVGVPPEAGRSLLGRELLSVTFAVRELYDQTPGPGAGERL